MASSLHTTPVAPLCVTSARLDRMRDLFARMDAGCRATPGSAADRRLGPICDALVQMGIEIRANPSPGIIGLVELAQAAQYWYRPPPHEGSEWHATDPASQLVCAMIAATFALFEGGVDA